MILDDPEDGPDGSDCHAFQRQEWKALFEYSLRVDEPGFELRAACGAVGGYHVVRRPQSWQVTDGGDFYIDPSLPNEPVAGTCNCVQKMIVVEDHYWQTNALGHELGHAIEYCPKGDHVGWDTRHLYDAISATMDAMCF